MNSSDTHVLEWDHPGAKGRLKPTVCQRWVQPNEIDNQKPTCPDCKAAMESTDAP